MWTAVLGAIWQVVQPVFAVLGIVLTAAILIVTFGEKMRVAVFDWVLRPWRNRHPWRFELETELITQESWAAAQGYGDTSREYAYVLVNRGDHPVGGVHVYVWGMGVDAYLGNAPAGGRTLPIYLSKVPPGTHADVSWSEGQRTGEQRVRVPQWNPRPKSYDRRGV